MVKYKHQKMSGKRNMINRIRTCSFTGHRPEKLHISEHIAKSLLEKAIDEAIKDNFTIFISGMARGIDMWAAEIVLEKKNEHPKIKLIAASPFKGFENSWSENEKVKYRKILECADEVIYCSDEYRVGVYMVRNKYMVDRSYRVIAAFNGESGGTKNTIKYAKSQGLEITNILETEFSSCQV